MSLVGIITVRKCDECKTTIVIKNEADQTEFNDRWHAGYNHDFCPSCRDTVKVQARIMDNEKLDAAITRSLSKYRGRIGGFAHVG